METGRQIVEVKKNQDRYALALVSDKAIAIGREAMSYQLVDIISTAYYDCGIKKPDETDLAILASNTYSEIEEYFKTIRVEEVKIAFKNGSRRLYGDFYGLNISTFHHWLKSFIHDDKRIKAIQSRKQEDIEASKPKWSAEQAEMEWKQTIVKQFNLYKEKNYLTCDFPKYQYEEFERRGLISETPEQKKANYEEAVASVKKKTAMRMTCPTSRKEKDDCLSFMEQIEKNTLTPENKGRIQNEARRIAIAKYYDSIQKLKL